MELPPILMLLASAIVLCLGSAHLLYTFRGAKLLPRDPQAIDAMKASTLGITKDTTVWKAWIGFNASHSMGAMLFGLVFGYLAVVSPALLFGSLFLQGIGFAMLLGFLALGWLYWFSVPFTGIAVATAFYVASIGWVQLAS
ncbi:hypothetical protein JN531_010620 [Flagellatimonas centrodinii]|uniref:LIC_13387 family protein n=1 Tax=Flagellatimonas centrodinii TaxID=2806210 RepID=UPI001FEEE4BA|nr:hypothetical protein [Flagellatimonas centrodinii]ULQ45573.1 hypothetical protein JN531_010620 [Flagellatimonas centrodinii]